MIRRISFLATGAELLNGDVQEGNCRYFAKRITELGGVCHSHLLVSDAKQDIAAGLNFLLQDADGVIVTGGLGPTSDDNTRFAIAEVLNQTLVFNEEVWAIIVERLKRFHLAIPQANRRQAYFPEHAILLPNAVGTAYGAKIPYKDKWIFMLPGPPRESIPMFEKEVITALEALSYLHHMHLKRWLTMGLVEAEIATELDALAEGGKASLSYCWAYPYLEIKMSHEPAQFSANPLQQQIQSKLQPYLVSDELTTPVALLKQHFESIRAELNIDDSVLSVSAYQEPALLQCLNAVKDNSHNVAYRFCFTCSDNLERRVAQKDYSGRVEFLCQAYHDNALIFDHKISTTCRGPEVIQFAEAYFLWQLSRFVGKIVQKST